MSILAKWKRTHGARSLLVAMLCLVALGAKAQTTVKYVHTDALGSVVTLTDAVGAVVEGPREYEPYGYQTTPAVQDGPGYTGHVQDAATGLTYMQQRYYDPEIGRMLSVDPVTAYGSSDMRHFNPYAYAFNNPYSFTDPDGRCPDGPQTGTRICGGGAGNNVSVIQVNPSGGGGGRDGGSSARDQRSSSAPAQQGSTGAPTSDGRIPVPGVVGWKTGEYDMSMTPDQVDSAGLVITGAATVAIGAVAVEAGAPYAASATAASGRYLFGKGGFLNRRPNLRIGIGRDGGQSVFRVGGNWLGKVPEPMRKALGIKEIKPGQYKWDLWRRGDL